MVNCIKVLVLTGLLGSISAPSPSWAAKLEKKSPSAPAVTKRYPAQQAAFESKRQRYAVNLVAKGLNRPWAVVPSPDGTLYITELDGAIRTFQNGTPGPSLGGIPQDLVVTGQGGLMDLAFHPGFAKNGYVYLTYSTNKNAKPSAGTNTRVSRFELNRGTLANEKILAQGGYGTDGAHYGSRLAFGPDGKLYASFGERHNKEKAQDLKYLNGKVIRLNDDGTVPKDNPFVGKGDALPEIFTRGHRNPQGLAFHPTLNILAESEHGPTGYDANIPGHGAVGKADEVNLLTAGGNYGWPIVFGTPQVLPWTKEMNQVVTDLSIKMPVREFSVPDGIAPSGMAYYSGATFKGWRNDLFVAALRGYLVRLKFSADGKTLVEDEILKVTPAGDRVRDVTTGNDGLIYVVTDSGLLLQIAPL